MNDAQYSIELRRIRNVFDFEYDFYEEQYRCDFEQKFIDHYYFHEIGFETVERFKHNLMALLNLKMPYYSQLYKTELASEGLEFLLNKDLKETFIRTLDTTGDVTGTNTSNDTRNSNGSNNTNGSNSSTDDYKESNVADGVASASLNYQYLTDVSQRGVKGTNESRSTNSNSETSKTEGRTTEQTTGREVEKTELISQGNIGVTSSAELLEKWRSVLINLDEMIINDCRNLFMGVF